MLNQPVEMPFDAIAVERWKDGLHLILSHQGKDMIEIQLPELAVGTRFTQAGTPGVLLGRLTT